LGFLPDSALPLALVVGAFLVILGLTSARRVLGLVIGLALLPLLFPLFDRVFELLPWWVNVLVVLAIGLLLFRAISSLLIGQRAADHMTGNLAADVVRGVLRLLTWPVRALARAALRPGDGQRY